MLGSHSVLCGLSLQLGDLLRIKRRNHFGWVGSLTANLLSCLSLRGGILRVGLTCIGVLLLLLSCLLLLLLLCRRCGSLILARGFCGTSRATWSRVRWSLKRDLWLLTARILSLCGSLHSDRISLLSNSHSRAASILLCCSCTSSACVMTDQLLLMYLQVGGVEL